MAYTTEIPDAADAFLKRLEQIDVGALDIGDLLKDLDQTSGQAHAEKAVGVSMPHNGSASATAPSTPLVRTASTPVNGSLLTDAPQRETRVGGQSQALTAAKSTGEQADAQKAPDGTAAAFPWTGVALAAVVVMGLGAFALRSSSPRSQASPPATQATVSPITAAAAAAPTTPTAAANGVPAARDAASIDSQLTVLTDTARQQLTTGQRADALATLGKALSLRADDRAVKALVTQAATEARREYDAARRAARAINATGTPRYVEAERLARTASRRRGAPDINTANGYVAAIAAMNASASEAAAKAEARAKAAQSAPPPQNIPVTTTAPSAAAPSQPVPTAASAPPTAQAPVRQDPQLLARAPEQPGAQIVDAPQARPAVIAPAPPPVQTPPVPAPAPASAPAARETTAAARDGAAALRARIVDEQSIRAVLQQYAAAHTRLDAAGVRAVYPSTDVAALQRSFARMRSQRVQIADEQIRVTGATATVICVWQTVFELSAGGPNRSAPQTTLTLQRSGDTWVIVSRH